MDERGVDVSSGIAGAIATAGPLAVAVMIGNKAAGLTAAIAGLNVALCVPRAGLRSRVGWGGAAFIASAGSLVAADLASSSTWLLAIVTLAWVGGWACLRGAGRQGALLGFVTGAVFVIMAGAPAGHLGLRLLWFAAGAVPGLILMIAGRGGLRQAPQCPGWQPRSTQCGTESGTTPSSALTRCGSGLPWPWRRCSNAR